MKCSTLSIILLVVLLIAGFTSCSTQWHLKRAIQKDPTILVQDTVIVTDTVVTKSTTVLDTITISKIDTVEIVKNNFRVKITRSYDTLIIDGGCESDTIVRTVNVPFEKIVYQERDKWYHKLYFGSFLLLILMFFLGLFRRLFQHS